MKDTCKIEVNTNGRLVPVLPDGTVIPRIVKDSITLEGHEYELKAGFMRMKLELFIRIEDLPVQLKK